MSAGERQARRLVLIIGAVLVLGFAWTRGTFDNFLWRVGLNYTTCIQNGFGATFCGGAAARYEQQVERLKTGG